MRARLCRPEQRAAIRETCKADCASKFITVLPCSPLKHIYQYSVLMVYTPSLSSCPRSLSRLVKTQMAARSQGHELESVMLLRSLQTCTVSGSKPDHATFRAPNLSAP
jgi:hypothetical protein